MTKIKSFKPKPNQYQAQPNQGQNQPSQPRPWLNPKPNFNQPPKNTFRGLKLIPLGGIGDVTKNMYVYEYGQDILIVDCGIGFPDEAMLGIDLVIPDITYLKDKVKKIRGIVISHGHDDHIGSLPYIWPQLRVPIYAPKLAAGFIKGKFAEHHLPTNQINIINTKTILKLGAFEVSFYHVTHSVPDANGLVINTPVGRIIHQADFKLDWTPVDSTVTEVGKLAVEGEKGVLLMLIDSLRVEKSGYSLSEKTIQPTFERIERESLGKVLITTTSSNIGRIQQAINVALNAGRKVSFIGRSMDTNFQISRDLGYLSVPPNLVIPMEEVKRYPDNKLMLLIGGSQGQPDSALSRVANNDHRFVDLHKGDSVVFSADPIPSSESAQYALIDKLTKAGANVYYTAMTDSLHVSVLPDTEVLIKDRAGNIQLKEIQQIDDDIEALSFDRKFCKVSFKKARRVSHPYKGKIYKIITKAGRSVSVTQSHSLFALKSGYITEVKSQDLRIGDYLLIPKAIPNLGSQQKLILSDLIHEKVHYRQKGGYIFSDNHCIGPSRVMLNNQLCRMLGYYLAEGSAPRHLSIVLNKSEKELIGEIEILIKQLLNCSMNFQVRGNAYEITFATPFWGQIFKNWFGENARSKHIPSFLFNASAEQKLNFLGAYINGDGGIDKGSIYSRIRIKTASKKLASDLLYLFSSIGIIAKYDHVQKNPERFVKGYKLRPTDCYVIRIQGENYIKFLLPYLSNKFKSYFYKYYLERETNKHKQTHSPEAFPLAEINLEHEIIPKPNTTLSGIWHEIANGRKLSQSTIDPDIIRRDALTIGNPLIYYLGGDLLFDPITKIEVAEYEGTVYDLSVPGTENFLGGFGGIFLHNSGHASSEEIKLMINLAKPKFLIPVGATFRQMKAFSKMVQDMGYMENQVLLPEDGQVINIQPHQVSLDGKVSAQNVYVDGLGVGDVSNIVLRDRQVMAEEGIVLVIVPIDAHTSRLSGDPDIVSRGFVFEKEAEELLSQAKEVVKSALSDHPEGILDWRFTRHHLEENLERLFYEETKRRPMILPVLVEV